MMKFTPAQFRDTLGLSQETLRHWRKKLPIFYGRNGRAPTFTPGDLVAGAVIKTLADQWGISVAIFAEQSVQLGRVCNETPWANLSTGALILSLSTKSCEFVSSELRYLPRDLSLLVPLAPIMERLTTTLLQDRTQAQSPIYFPPTEVKQRSGGGTSA